MCDDNSLDQYAMREYWKKKAAEGGETPAAEGDLDVPADSEPDAPSQG